MKAWQHARSSATALGGEWRDHLSFHSFLDQTKASYAQIPHRFLLHNTDLGLALSSLALGRDDTEALLARHLDEDLRRQATLADWLQALRPALLPRLRRPGPLAGLDIADQGLAVAARWHLADPHLAVSVAQFLGIPAELAPGVDPQATMLVLRNTLGPFLAERCLGVGREVEMTDGSTRFVGVRDLAEALIVGHVGALVPFSDVARAVDIADWMYRGPT